MRNNKQIVREINVPAAPQHGAREVAGKDSADYCETLRQDSLPKASPVVDAKEDVGAAKRAIEQQVGQNGNPKKRDDNTFGIGAKASANEKELK